MKKFSFYGLLAAALLMTASCQEDITPDNLPGEGSIVTFNVGTPDIATRAYSDGMTANKLQYAVYDKDGNCVFENKDTEINNGTAQVQLELASQSTYSLIFWASEANAPYAVDFSQKTMTVNYDNVNNNDEKLDAFYAYVEPFVVDPTQLTKKVDLKRPFAQLNIGTDDLATCAAKGFAVSQSQVEVKLANTLNLVTGVVSGETAVRTFKMAALPSTTDGQFPVTGYDYVAMDYLLVGADKEIVDVTFKYGNTGETHTRTITSVPVRRNYRTNIYGSLFTNEMDVEVEIKPGFGDDDKYGVIDGKTYIKVSNIQEFNAAFNDEKVDIIILTEDIVLSQVLTRADDVTCTISKGKELIIDLNGKKISATSSATGKNYNMFDVRGTLTVKNGNLEYEHKGENMLWNNSTNIFNVTDGGVLNLIGVTAKNLGGSDMAFVAHLNNWGEVTLNVDNSNLESTYIPVRVFNSGPDMNNVTIKNSTLKGDNYSFWVQNYTLADFGNDAEKTAKQQSLLNLNIYNQGNTFIPDVTGILYGFTNSIKSDAYGITKSVSEDGSVVTLGSVVENGIVRRNVAGAEENETIKEVYIEEGISVLYDRTFRRYYALEKVVLPGTLTTIGEVGTGVFQSCDKLKEILLPESLTVLGIGSFYGCRSLESINIPAGITRIEDDVFRETGLKTIVFHEGVTYFGKQAFRDCEAISEIYIKAPQFTVESNTFLNAAAPYPTMTIHVANAEMKAYLESKLDNHQKTFITVVAPTNVSSNEEFNDAITAGGDVQLDSDIQYGGNFSNDAVINLNNHTFEATATITLGNNADLTMVGGNYEVNGTYGHVDVRPSTAEGSTVIYEDVDFSYNKLNPSYGPSTNRLGTVVEVCATVADAKTVIKFKNCTFDNAQILFEGMSGKTGEFDAVFENCTFNALTSSAPIYVQNYVKGTLTLTGCVFNLECTSSTASAVSVSPSSSTSVVVNATDNTLNAVAATPYTFDPSKGETEVHTVKVNGTPKDIKFISAYENTTVNETGTVKTGIAK